MSNPLNDMHPSEQFAIGHERLNSNGFYRSTAQGFFVSTLGIGTYLGKMDDATDARYTEAVVSAIRGGINVIDTSLNYRHQRSERAIGKALQLLEGVDRESLLVCTKAGYLVPNAVPPEINAVRGHSMDPVFLSDQLDRSRSNLGLDTIDVFYLHNPETELGSLEPQDFYAAVCSAFSHLEEQAAVGKIRYYGAATWEGFRKPGQLSVESLCELAIEIGGPNHHFRFIQLPFNLGMPEAFTTQREQVLAAERHGVTVVASASILQSRLAKDLPSKIVESFPGLTTDAQRAIQFTRSTPGIKVALVGMSREEHVRENLGVGNVPPLGAEEYFALYRDL